METVHTFGTKSRLHGVLAKPDLLAAPVLPVVVLPNAYATPRIGLFRMHVEMARAFARAGFSALRFDVSGVGDSPARDSEESYQDRYRDDLGAAIDFVCGNDPRRRVVLVGHCDGAYHAYLAALADERVAGLVLIDGFLEPNWRYRMRLRMRRLGHWFGPRAWARRWRDRREPAATLGLHGITRYEEPPLPGYRSLAELRADAAVFEERGVQLLWVFSEESTRLSHAQRLVRELVDDRGERCASFVVPGARHVYPEAYARLDLTARIQSWLRERFIEQVVRS